MHLNNQIIIYQSEDGGTRIEVKSTGETVWLSQQQLCELYNTSKANVSEHIKHIFEDGELEEESVVRKFRTTATDGKSYNVTFNNLDMIISLRYRFRSVIATHFRRWATERLKHHSSPDMLMKKSGNMIVIILPLTFNRHHLQRRWLL